MEESATLSRRTATMEFELFAEGLEEETTAEAEDPIPPAAPEPDLPPDTAPAPEPAPCQSPVVTPDPVAPDSTPAAEPEPAATQEEQLLNQLIQAQDQQLDELGYGQKWQKFLSDLQESTRTAVFEAGLLSLGQLRGHSCEELRESFSPEQWSDLQLQLARIQVFLPETRSQRLRQIAHHLEPVGLEVLELDAGQIAERRRRYLERTRKAS